MTVMKNLLRVPTVLLLASLGLTGCIGLKPAPMYRLDSGTTEVPERTDGASVLLAPVALADYLQRDALLQRLADGSYRLFFDAQSKELGNHIRTAGFEFVQ